MANLAVALWQDTKPICLASTNGDPDKTQDITRKRKDGTRIMIKCPETIVAYNAHMNDQLRFKPTTGLLPRSLYKLEMIAS